MAGCLRRTRELLYRGSTEAFGFHRPRLLGFIVLAAFATATLAGCPKSRGSQVQRVECVSNLRRAAVACLNYASDHNERFPESLREIESAVPAALLRCPASGKEYKYYSRGDLNKMRRPAKVVLLKCPTHRLKAYADGHLK